jgi:homoserine O-acetyltransferase/O-succinyltransferase
MTTPRLFDVRLPELPLEHGGVVRQHHARGWWWGPEEELSTLAAGVSLLPRETLTAPSAIVQRSTSVLPRQPVSLNAKVPTVLLVHALTGDARAGGEGGWWGPLVGVGQPLDPNKVRVLCFNNLGSNYGSTGPLDHGWPDDAKLSVRDQARALWSALDALGIEKVQLAAGGSLGGRIILAMAALRPEGIDTLLPLGASLDASAWVLGFTHVQRQVIAAAPGPRGLELARQVAMLTYRAEPGFALSQPERRIGSYLEHQGVKLAQRFHPRSYLALLDAMDTVDLGLREWRGRALVVDIDTDVLFTPASVEALSAELRSRGATVERATLHSPHGHDAFLIEWAQLRPLISRALALAGVAT